MPSITAGDLKLAYTAIGADGGPAVLLNHGWPNDASTWNGVAPVLADAGPRVPVPTGGAPML